MSKRLYNCILFSLLVGLNSGFWLGCAQKKKSSSAPPVVAEEAPCTTIQAVGNPITLSGLANYQYYKPVSSLGLTKDSNGNAYVNPIRRAEVRVKNSQGAIVQCGLTDDLGQYAINIENPGASADYTIEVNSRSDSSYVKATILDKPANKLFYSLKTSVTVQPSETTHTVSDLVADATGTLEGGAFHIFDKILQVNDFLRANTTDASCPTCSGFSVAPKVTVYWTKGFNPGSYFGESSGLSYFDSEGSVDSGAPGLYILGGSNGDVDNSDTDHFDDSVIIHEYGHFLQSVYWNTDSPGGYHNGNLIIDPRLAFSEGFSNFLPSLVQSDPIYLDTMGSPNGSTAVIVRLDLENEPYDGALTSGRDKIITKSPLGEGTYREVSVARALYDYTDTASDITFDSSGNNGASGGVDETSAFSFAYLWLALTNNTFGLNAPFQHFVSMAHFNKSLYAALDLSSFADVTSEKSKLDTARLGEFQTNDESEYAALVVKSDTACSSSRIITPAKDRPVGDGTYYHDLFASTDFYRVDHPGGTFDLRLDYVVTGSPTPDLDLYIYKEHHNLSEAADIVAYSDGNTTSPELVSANLAAGTYLIVVNVVTDGINFNGTSSATYTISSGGKVLCNTP